MAGTSSSIDIPDNVTIDTLPAGDNNIGNVDVLSIAAGDNNIGNVDVASIAAGDNNIGNVDIVTLPSIPAGTNNIGDVDIASIAAGDNNIGNVDVLTLPSIPAGTNNIGDVDVLTLPPIPAGTNNIGDVDIASIAAGDNNIGNVDIVTLPSIPAGTNNIGDVDVLTMPTVGVLVLCDDVGPFIRHINNGVATDTEIDGETPYVVTGDVVVCGGTSTGGFASATVVQLCDSDDSTPFLRHIAYDDAGDPIGATDTELDGITPYTVVGDAVLCSDQETVTGNTCWYSLGENDSAGVIKPTSHTGFTYNNNGGYVSTASSGSVVFPGPLKVLRVVYNGEDPDVYVGLTTTETGVINFTTFDTSSIPSLPATDPGPFTDTVGGVGIQILVDSPGEIGSGSPGGTPSIGMDSATYLNIYFSVPVTNLVLTFNGIDSSDSFALLGLAYFDDSGFRQAYGVVETNNSVTYYDTLTGFPLLGSQLETIGCPGVGNGTRSRLMDVTATPWVSATDVTGRLISLSMSVVTYAADNAVQTSDEIISDLPGGYSITWSAADPTNANDFLSIIGIDAGTAGRILVNWTEVDLLFA